MRLWLISPAISAMLKLSTFLKGIKGMGQLHAQGLEAGGRGGSPDSVLATVAGTEGC